MLAGGTYKVSTGASTYQYWGSFSGSGTINVANTAPDSWRQTYKYFYGDVSALDAQSTLTIDQIGSNGADVNNGVRLNSDFAGTVKMNFNWSNQDIVSFGFNNPNTSGMSPNSRAVPSSARATERAVRVSSTPRSNTSTSAHSPASSRSMRRRQPENTTRTT